MRWSGQSQLARIPGACGSYTNGSRNDYWTFQSQGRSGRSLSLIQVSNSGLRRESYPAAIRYWTIFPGRLRFAPSCAEPTGSRPIFRKVSTVERGKSSGARMRTS